MDCSLPGDILYKVQQMLFRLSLLQSYALPIRQYAVSSLAVCTIQASILSKYVRSLVKFMTKESLLRDFSQYVTPSYLASVRRLADFLARYVPPFLDKLFAFYDCCRRESSLSQRAYTQQDLLTLQRFLQEDLQERSQGDESYHWLHFSYLVLPYYQKAKERLSQVIDESCAAE